MIHGTILGITILGDGVGTDLGTTALGDGTILGIIPAGVGTDIIITMVAGMDITTIITQDQCVIAEPDVQEVLITDRDIIHQTGVMQLTDEAVLL